MFLSVRGACGGGASKGTTGTRAPAGKSLRTLGALGTTMGAAGRARQFPWRQQCWFHSSGSPFAIVPFKLADIGEGIAECEITKWHIVEGQQISQFDTICEVQSDKASTEITSRYDGVVKKLHYAKGDLAKVGTALVDIEVEDEDKATPAPAHDAQGGQQEKESQGQEARGHQQGPSSAVLETVFATPAVRHLAGKHQLDLRQVQGSGRNGRIHKEDVLKLINAAPRQSSIETPSSSLPHKTAATSAETRSPVVGVIPIGGQDRVVPLSGYGRIMAKTMTASNAIPHFGYNDEIVMDKLVALRKEMKQLAEQRGTKLTNMPLLIKAASLALKQHPILNSSYDEGQSALIYKSNHNIGVAMDTPNGLVVPNVKNVQDKTVFEIAMELNRLQAAGAKASLSREDLSGGTFTLSNIGSIGGTYASPVLVLPEVAIGAIGKIQRLPRFDEQGQVVPVMIMNVSWAADHRVIDGATMAHFSNLWKHYLENPQTMLMDTR